MAQTRQDEDVNNVCDDKVEEETEYSNQVALGMDWAKTGIEAKKMPI